MFGDIMCRFVRSLSRYNVKFPSNIFNSILILQVQFMIVVTCHASVYTLVMMSLDRFLAVVHPISSMAYRTEQNAVLWVIKFKATVERHLWKCLKLTMIYFILSRDSALKIIWVIIVLASIPWFLAHGEIIFANVKTSENSTKVYEEIPKCMFLYSEAMGEEGFNYPAFQVSTIMWTFIIRNLELCLVR